MTKAIVPAERRDEVLQSWYSLIQTLPEFGEDEVRELLNHAVKHGKPHSMKVRLYQRYNKLRAMREKAALGITNAEA